MLASANESIAEAARRLHILTQDQDIQLQCEARERYEFDMASARAEGLRKGEKIGLQKGEQIGLQKGEQIGLQKGEQRVNQLQRRLMADGRTDDLMRSIKDPAYQKQLMREYGII